jgi:hypothetical protein
MTDVACEEGRRRRGGKGGGRERKEREGREKGEKVHTCQKDFYGELHVHALIQLLY